MTDPASGDLLVCDHGSRRVAVLSRAGTAGGFGGGNGAGVKVATVADRVPVGRCGMRGPHATPGMALQVLWARAGRLRPYTLPAAGLLRSPRPLPLHVCCGRGGFTSLAIVGCPFQGLPVLLAQSPCPHPWPFIPPPPSLGRVPPGTPCGSTRPTTLHLVPMAPCSSQTPAGASAGRGAPHTPTPPCSGSSPMACTCCGSRCPGPGWAPPPTGFPRVTRCPCPTAWPCPQMAPSCTCPTRTPRSLRGG